MKSPLVVMMLGLAVGAFALPGAAAAEPAEQPLAVATHEHLHSAVLDEDRVIDVYVPPSYRAGEARYPVLYLLDGDDHLLHAAAASQFLADAGRLPELIIVSVPNTDRNRDLTPARKADFRLRGRLAGMQMPTAGGADKFLRFLTDELIPSIEARYRTSPYRLLFGHSLGGLFALHAFQRRPDVFRAVIAASPALWWNDGELVATVPRVASGLAPLDRALFLSLANESDYTGPVYRLGKALGAVPGDRLRSRFTQFPDENHLTTPPIALMDGLKFVFDGWNLPGRLFLEFPAESLRTSADAGTKWLDEVLAHYARLSSRYGFPIHPPERLLGAIGYQLLEAKRSDAAVAAFERSAAFYPHSASALDSWASALAQKGQFSEAFDLEQRAIALGVASRDPQLREFQGRASEWKRLAAASTKRR